jgi:CubicO group peptidase (beta-lactamase class C family)
MSQIQTRSQAFLGRGILEYSNSNYLVLAALIEAASGLSYPSYIERFIFKPLLMHEGIVNLMVELNNMLE